MINFGFGVSVEISFSPIGGVLVMINIVSYELFIKFGTGYSSTFFELEYLRV